MKLWLPTVISENKVTCWLDLIGDYRSARSQCQETSNFLRMSETPFAITGILVAMKQPHKKVISTYRRAPVDI